MFQLIGSAGEVGREQVGSIINFPRRLLGSMDKLYLKSNQSFLKDQILATNKFKLTVDVVDVGIAKILARAVGCNILSKILRCTGERGVEDITELHSAVAAC
jgi:hypothetical protein